MASPLTTPRQIPTGYDAGPLSGPYTSSGDNSYIIAKDDSAVSVDALKSSNPNTTAYSAADGSNNPTTSNIIRGTTGILDVHAYPVGNVLHVAILSYTTPAMGATDVYWDYCTFTMDTDSWDTSPGDPSVHNVQWDFGDFAEGYIRVMVRASSDGDIVMVGPGTPTTDMNTDHATFYHTYYDQDGGPAAWSTPAEAGSNQAYLDDWAVTLSDTIPSGADAGTYVACFQRDSGINQGLFRWCRFTGASHTKASYESASKYYHNLRHPSAPFITYNDGGTWRGGMAFVSVGNTLVQGYTFDPTAQPPTETDEDDITGTDNPYTSSPTLYCNEASTDTRYCLYIVAGTPDTIKVVSSVNQGTWGDIQTVRTAANDTRLLYPQARAGTSAVNGTTSVIAYLYRDVTNGTVYYDEYTIDTGQTVAAGPATGKWAGVTVGKTLGGVNKAAGPATGKWVGVTVPPSPGAVNVGAGPAVGRWDGVAVALDTATTKLANPAIGTWGGVPVVPSFGAVNVPANPAVGSWQGVAATPSPGALGIAANPAVGSWQGVTVSVSTAAVAPANPAIGTWGAVTVTPAPGGVNIAVSPSVGTWGGVTVSVSQADYVSVNPAIGTWGGVVVSPSAGAVNVTAVPAVGSWLAVTITPLPGGLNVAVSPSVGTWAGNVVGLSTGQFITANPATGKWAGVGVTPSIGAVNVAAGPVVGTWVGVPLTVFIPPQGIAANAAVGTWAGVSVSPSVGAVQATVGPAVGTWVAVITPPSAGAQQIPAGPAVGLWGGVPVGVSLLGLTVPVGIAPGTWGAVPVGSTVGPIAIVPVPAVGTWMGGTVDPAFFVELVIELAHQIDVFRAWAIDVDRDWATDAERATIFTPNR